MRTIYIALTGINMRARDRVYAERYPSKVPREEPLARDKKSLVAQANRESYNAAPRREEKRDIRTSHVFLLSRGFCDREKKKIIALSDIVY